MKASILGLCLLLVGMQASFAQTAQPTASTPPPHKSPTGNH